MLKFFDSAHKCPLHLQLVGDGEKKNWGEKNLVIERGCVLMRMSQKNGLYHITAFFLKFCKKGCCGGWGEKWCFLWKKFGLLSFFLLLSFRSKMRMIEVFVFLRCGVGKRKRRNRVKQLWATHDKTNCSCCSTGWYLCKYFFSNEWILCLKTENISFLLLIIIIIMVVVALGSNAVARLKSLMRSIKALEALFLITES